MSKKFTYLIFFFSIFFISNNSFAKSPEKIVKSYLKADDVEERSEFVIDSEKTIKYMDFYYDGQTFDFKKIKVKNIDCPKKPQDNHDCTVNAKFAYENKLGRKKNSESIYYLIYKDKSWLIDWERSIGFNRKTLSSLRATGQNNATVYAEAELDDNYSSWDGITKSKFQSVELFVSDDYCNTFIPRDRVDVLNKAIDILSFGEIDVTVNIELWRGEIGDYCFILDINEGFQKL